MKRWLENHGDLLLRWDRGCIVIESFYEKQFKALGGDLGRLIACFEDNGEMSGAIDDYFRERV
jgi:hypothetical protein